jgi:type II secretory pathway pseudopilin PulG
MCESGFTLLEIIVALALMMIGIASAFALFAAGTALHKRSVDQTNTALIAEQVFSDLDSKLTTGIDIAKLQKKGASLPEFRDYTYDLHLIPIDKNGEELYVDLTVRWKTRGKIREQTFSTIRIRSLPFKERK